MSTRPRAALDVDIDVVGDLTQVLRQCGVTIVGSLKSETDGTVRLLIESELLPDECISEERRVIAQLREERAPGRRSVMIEQFALVI